MALTNDEARARLDQLVQIPGELRLIRPWLRPEFRPDPNDLKSAPTLAEDATDDERRAYDLVMKDAASFLHVDIVAITAHPTDPALVLAETADGSHVAGEPAAVLARCRQWESV